MKGERTVGGLRCSEVLACLQEYLDCELGQESRLGIETHLKGCDRCARFGGRYAETVRALREALLEESEPAVPTSWRSRLWERLE